MKKIILLVIVVSILGFTLSIKCKYSPLVYKTQQQEGGTVTLEITPQVLSPGKQPIFSIVFDTHSVDLDFDIAAAALLTDANSASYGAAIWNGNPPGGHHRKGILTFTKILKDTADVATLTLSDIAERDWKFRWTL